MKIELAICCAERRLQKIADSQYWAERALIDARIAPDAPAWCLPDRIKALNEIYNDLLARRAKRGEV